jgi:protein TonB
MQVAETLSTDRTVPAVMTIAIHLLFAYVVAVSVGIIPKPPLLRHPVLVDVPNEPKPPEPVTRSPLPSIDPIPQISDEPAGPLTVPFIPVAEIDPLVGEVPIEIGGGGGELRPLVQAIAARLLQHTDPPYPSVSRIREEQGVVQVRVTISPYGTVGDVSVEKSSGYARLDEAALKAVREWRFAPAMRGELAVVGSVIVPVRFELRR